MKFKDQKQRMAPVQVVRLNGSWTARTAQGSFLGFEARNPGSNQTPRLTDCVVCVSSLTLPSSEPPFHHSQNWRKDASFRDLEIKCLKGCLQHSKCSRSALLLLIIQKLYAIDGDPTPYSCKPFSFVYLCLTLPSRFYIYLICIDT